MEQLLPGHVAAEQEAEHEDEEAHAQDDDVDVEGQVEELLRRHAAGEAEDLEDRSAGSDTGTTCCCAESSQEMEALVFHEGGCRHHSLCFSFHVSPHGCQTKDERLEASSSPHKE